MLVGIRQNAMANRLDIGRMLDEDFFAAGRTGRGRVVNDSPTVGAVNRIHQRKPGVGESEPE